MLSDSSYICNDYATRKWDFITQIEYGASEVVGTGNVTNPWQWPGYMLQQVTDQGFFLQSDLSSWYPNRFTAVLPGCSMGNLDQYPGWWTPHELLLFTSPLNAHTAVFLTGPARPNGAFYHLRMLELYVQRRTSGQFGTIQEALLAAKLQLVAEQPGAKSYVQSFVQSGWLVTYPGMLGMTAVGDHRPSRATRLDGATPSPLTQCTTIRFTIGRTGTSVRLAVFDATGRTVCVLHNGTPMDAGHHTLVWDGLDAQRRMVACGVYYLRLDAGDTHMNRSLVVLR
jgi:hypothetical protein